MDQIEQTEQTTTPAATPAVAPVETAQTSPAKTEDEFLADVYKAASAGEPPPDPAKIDENGKPHGKDGKFVGKAPPKVEAVAAEEPAEAKDEPADEAEQPADQPEVKTESGHFRGWSAEKKQAFEKLPKEAQDFVLSHQKDLNSFHSRKANEWTAAAQAVQPYLGAIDEHRDYLQHVSTGLKISPDRVVSGLMKTDTTLRFGTYQDKVDTLLGMAQDYGVPLRLDTDPLGDANAPGGDTHAIVHNLNQKIARLESQLAGQARQAEQAMVEGSTRALEAMKTATDAQGNKLYPYFDTVRPHMASLIETGHAATLEEAYEKAAAPIVRAVQSSVAARTQRLATDQSASKQTNRINVVSSPVEVERYASEDEMLSAAYRRASSM